MKKSLTHLVYSIPLVISLPLTSCDSDPRTDTEAIPDTVNSRGYDPEVLAANPNGTPLIPININAGDTITFTDVGTPFNIPNDFPLQTFVGESSGILRQQNSGNLEIDENTFRWIWSPATSSMFPSNFFFPTDNVLGTGLAAFENRTQGFLNLGEGAGSSGADTNSGVITPTIITAVNSVGALAVANKSYNNDSTLGAGGFITTNMVWVPTLSNITFLVTSNNSDLLTPPHVIRGSYTQNYTWSRLMLDNYATPWHSETGTSVGNGVSLLHTHPTPTSSLWFLEGETRTGNFEMTLTDLFTTNGPVITP